MAKAPLLTNAPWSAGFSVVEVLLAVTIFGLMTAGVMGAIVYGRSSAGQFGDRAQAVELADEGIEASRNIRDANFSLLASGTTNGLSATTQWGFSGTSDNTGIFKREVIITTPSTDRRSVTSRITWSGVGGSRQVDAVMQFSNFAAAMKKWSTSTLTGSLDVSGIQNGLKVAVQGNYAYVVRNTGTPNFAVVDLTNSSTLSLTGSLTLGGNPTNIAVSGNYAYVTNANNAGELEIVNISNPAAPSSTGIFNATGNADGAAVAVAGTTAYLARLSNSGSAEFTIVNVSTPATPTQVGAYSNAVNMNALYVSNNYAFVATGSDTQEIMVIDVSVPATPTLAGSFNLTGTNDATAIDGFGTNLLVGQATTLYSMSTTTPTAPTQTGTFTAAGTINDVAHDFNNMFAFLGTSSTTGEFQVVSITNLASMSSAAIVDVAGTASTISGVAYSSTFDVAIGACAADTLEVVRFVRNP